MAMPNDLILVRHGQSEANVAQHAEKQGDDINPYLDVYARHDFEQRLSPLGIEQAQAAGEWLQQNLIDPTEFDERYVSPFFRTLETAEHLGGLACQWLPDVRLIERDWGLFGSTPLQDRLERFPETERMKQLSSFFVRYDGGESIADVVYRFRDFVGTLNREMEGKRVLAVAHGELMWAARYVLERMMPQEWQTLDKDKTQRIGNCCILWYSRVNPDDPGDVRKSMSDGWRRMIDPIDPSKSLHNGEWQKLDGKRHFSGAQLHEIVSTAPPLLTKALTEGIA